MKTTEEKIIPTDNIQPEKVEEVSTERQELATPAKEEQKETPKIQDFEDRISKLLDVVSKQQDQIKELTTSFKEKADQLDALQQEIDSKKPLTLKVISFEGGGYDFSKDKERILSNELAELKKNAKKILDSFESQFA